MMYEIIFIIFSLIIMAIIGVVVYLTIDYFKYKDSVDESIKISSDNIKTNFNVTSNNITLAASALDYKYNNITKGLTDSINIQDTNVKIMSSNLNNFDSGLKKYFEFTDNTNTPINDKLFKHVFTSINPNLNLITHVNAVSGMTVKTSGDMINSNNFRICDNTNNKNCINLNVYNGNFNITPENSTNNLIINNKNKTPLANFDLSNESIYLGSGDDSAPVYINNCNIYFKNLNLINDPLTSYTDENISRLSSKIDIDTINNITNTIIATYMIINDITTENILNNTIDIKLISYNKIPANSTININIPELNNTGNNTNNTGVIMAGVTSINNEIVLNDKTFSINIKSEIPPKTNINIRISNTNGFNVSGIVNTGDKLNNMTIAEFS